MSSACSVRAIRGGRVGRTRFLEKTLYAVLIALNSIPKVALAPLFVICAAGLVINSFGSNPVEAAAGVFLIALGLPVYFYYHRKLKLGNGRQG